MHRRLLRLLTLVVLAVIPSMATGAPALLAAGTTYAGSFGGCHYAVKANLNHKGSKGSYTAKLTCSGQFVSTSAAGMVAGHLLTIKSITGFDGRVVKENISLPLKPNVQSRPKAFFLLAVKTIEGLALSTGDTNFQSLDSEKQSLISSGPQALLNQDQQDCQKAPDPNDDPYCGAIPNDKHTGFSQSGGNDASVASISGKLPTDPMGQKAEQDKACPALALTGKIPGVFIICVPTFLYGHADFGSDNVVFTPGGVLEAFPLGASLSTLTTPRLITKGSILMVGGAWAGFNLEVQAKAFETAGSLLGLIDQLTIKAKTVNIGHLSAKDIAQAVHLPSWLVDAALGDWNNNGEVDIPSLVWAGGLNFAGGKMDLGKGSDFAADGSGGAGALCTATGGAKQLAGGSYGGRGGSPYVTYGPSSIWAYKLEGRNEVYGNPFNPNQPGAGGGGDCDTNAGSSGGGLIQIKATSKLVVDGSVHANGDDPGYFGGQSGGGGSGGGININTAALLGTGTVAADGGSDCDPNICSGSFGGMGGGGRIAITYGTSHWKGSVEAYGGRDLRHPNLLNDNQPLGAGGAGTISWHGTGKKGTSQLVIAANTPKNAYPPADYTPYLGSWFKAKVAPKQTALTLKISGGARVITHSVTVGTLKLANGGVLTSPPGATCATISSCTLSVNAVTINVDKTSRIDMTGRGYLGGKEGGKGKGGAPPGVAGSEGAAGGCHGGLGGGNDSDRRPGPTYDNSGDPVLPGGGGGGIAFTTCGCGGGGSNGGGVLLVTATTLKLKGKLMADGQDAGGPSPEDPAWYNDDGGAGAGGSIQVHAKTLKGGGVVEARGGNACVLDSDLVPGLSSNCANGTGNTSGGGGGGRVLVQAADQTAFSGTINVDGGINRADADYPGGTGSSNTISTGQTLTVTSTADPQGKHSGDYTHCPASGSTGFTLRCAILVANHDGLGDTIDFNIPADASGCKSQKIGGTNHTVYTIVLQALLPQVLADQTTIDGYSQPGTTPNTNSLGQSDNAVIGIVLDGSKLDSASLTDHDDGLYLYADHDTVQGLSVEGFGQGPGDAQIRLGGTGETVQGSFVGLTPSGKANAHGTNGHGIALAYMAAKAKIGGSWSTEPSTMNVISGNQYDGIVFLGSPKDTIQGNIIGPTPSGGAGPTIQTAGIAPAFGAPTSGIQPNDNATIGGKRGSTANLISANGDGIDIADGTGTTITGNLIGTDLTGSKSLGNSGTGINVAPVVSHGSTTIGGTGSGAGNIIGGNQEGVVISGAGSRHSAGFPTTVVGNYIGTNTSNSKTLGNTTGLEIDDSAGVTVGGTSAGDSNIISGNSGNGVVLDFGAAQNTVSGNLVGTKVDGSKALQNGGDGVLIDAPAKQNIIGGTQPGAGNLISGNAAYGVEIDGGGVTSGVFSNVIEGNTIGLSASAAALGNQAGGLYAHDGARGDLVGGRASGAGNVIAGNQGPGVQIGNQSDSPTDKATIEAVEGNAVYDNAGTPGGIVLAGPNASGPNCTTASRPYADTGVLCPTISTASTSSIGGKACASCTIDVFLASSPADPSGHGQARTYLGTATADASGAWSLSTFLVPVTTGKVVTATATTPPSSTKPAGTSEFAKNSTVS